MAYREEFFGRSASSTTRGRRGREGVRGSKPANDTPFWSGFVRLQPDPEQAARVAIRVRAPLHGLRQHRWADSPGCVLGRQAQRDGLANWSLAADEFVNTKLIRTAG